MAPRAGPDPRPLAADLADAATLILQADAADPADRSPRVTTAPPPPTTTCPHFVAAFAGLTWSVIGEAMLD